MLCWTLGQKLPQHVSASGDLTPLLKSSRPWWELCHGYTHLFWILWRTGSTMVWNSLSSSDDAAFFSGSVKSMEQLPFFFPANYLQYLNGSDLPPNPGPEYITNDLVAGIQGVIPESQYNDMVNSP